MRPTCFIVTSTRPPAQEAPAERAVGRRCSEVLHSSLCERACPIRESLENIRKFSEALAHLLDQREGDLALALSDLRSASTGFRELVEGNRSRVDSTIGQFHRASMDLEMLTKQLSELSSTFTKIADKIERGEGTLGAVVQDEALYRDIKKTVQSLDELILDIKEHPKRYIHLELF